jgi:hypothetical protein
MMVLTVGSRMGGAAGSTAPCRDGAFLRQQRWDIVQQLENDPAPATAGLDLGRKARAKKGAKRAATLGRNAACVPC